MSGHPPESSSIYVHVRYPEQCRAVRSRDGETVYLHLGSNVTVSMTGVQFAQLYASGRPVQTDPGSSEGTSS